ncbi:hypothetical protein [Aliarcobacter butzleri]|nr:hypothetical protein [Aliarcobacter butzleri]MCT7557320.1 hypothetical protein [Aliarcobacter butzleri]MCT7557416.1 hypothetical protein [Aliarcobacter butzleri]MCT7592443.1 hypothetical protein [Aliarcobacter butzleri]MCT7595054.1 hypothetical protein [Aliarcobacter butzleri]MCT7602491.1 hypothetical protein [Aliarcobacter butzleri]
MLLRCGLWFLDTDVKQKVLLQMDEEQQFLVNMIQNEISKSFG